MQLFSRNKAIVALSLGALALGACGDDVTVPVAPAAPVVVTITPPSALMNIGEALNFAVQISGGSTTPTLTACAVTPTTVATATVAGSACRVTAVAAGNATVTATASTGQIAAASIAVSAPAPAITSLAVSPSAQQLAVGASVTLVPTVQPAGRTATYSYTSSSSAIASVTAAGVVTAVAPGTATITVAATGSATGFTTATINQAVTITVSAFTPGLNSLDVQPSSLAMTLGSTAILARAVAGPRASAATFSVNSTEPTRATAALRGDTIVVTAVSAGSAVITVTAQSVASGAFAASSITALVPVTVSPSAQVVITSLTDNGTTIDITNVNGQFEVNLSVQPNGQNVSSVQAWVCAPGETVPACAARTNGVPASQQSFASGGAQASAVQLYINSAEFTTPDFTTGANANTLYKNGLRTIVATVTTTPAASATIASNNLSQVNFNNPDGWTISWTQPTNRANDAGGITWYGGPSTPDALVSGATSGNGSFTVVPVLYTPDRNITTANLNLSPQLAGIDGSVGTCFSAGFVAGTQSSPDLILTTRPFTARYGSGSATGDYLQCGNTSSATGAGGAVSGTAGYAPVVNASIDQNNAAGPNNAGIAPAAATSIFTRIGGGGMPIDANRYRSSLAYRPNTIFIPGDYSAPAMTRLSLRNGSASADSGWLNGAYQLGEISSSSGLSASYLSSDVGVGVVGSGDSQKNTVFLFCNTPSTIPSSSNSTAAVGCSAPVAQGGMTSTAAGINLPESANLTNSAYFVQAYETDRLGNRRTSRPFSWATSSGSHRSIYPGTTTNGAPTTTVFYAGADLTAPVLVAIPNSGPGAIANFARPDRDSIYATTGSGLNTAGAIAAEAAVFAVRFTDSRSGFPVCTGLNCFSGAGVRGGNLQITRRSAPPVVSVSNDALVELLINGSNGPARSLRNSIDAGTYSLDASVREFTIPIASVSGRNNATALPLNVGTPVDGYYTVTGTLFDRAGNFTALTPRSVAVDNSSPMISSLTAPAVFAGNATVAFTPTASDALELISADLSLTYGQLGKVDGTAGAATQPTGLRFVRVPAFANSGNALLGLWHNPFQSLTDNKLASVVGAGTTLGSSLTLPIPFIQQLITVDNADAPIAPATYAGYTDLKPSAASATVFDIRATSTQGFIDLGRSTAGASVNIGAGQVPTSTKNFTTASGGAGILTWGAFNPTSAALEFRVLAGSSVTNPPFTSVYVVRAGATEWDFLGTATFAGTLDQGVNRFFRYTFTFASANQGQFVQAALTNGDIVRAIGVDGSGNALSTRNVTFGVANALVSGEVLNNTAILPITELTAPQNITLSLALNTNGANVVYGCSSNSVFVIAAMTAPDVCTLTRAGVVTSTIPVVITFTATGSAPGFNTNTITKTVTVQRVVGAAPVNAITSVAIAGSIPPTLVPGQMFSLTASEVVAAGYGGAVSYNWTAAPIAGLTLTNGQGTNTATYTWSLTAASLTGPVSINAVVTAPASLGYLGNSVTGTSGPTSVAGFTTQDGAFGGALTPANSIINSSATLNLAFAASLGSSNPANSALLNCNSSNTAAATVSASGVVTALAVAGPDSTEVTCTVSRTQHSFGGINYAARVDGVTNTVRVTVVVPVPAITSVSVTGSIPATLLPGDVITLTAVPVQPAGAVAATFNWTAAPAGFTATGLTSNVAVYTWAGTESRSAAALTLGVTATAATSTGFLTGTTSGNASGAITTEGYWNTDTPYSVAVAPTALTLDPTTGGGVVLAGNLNILLSFISDGVANTQPCSSNNSAVATGAAGAYSSNFNGEGGGAPRTALITCELYRTQHSFGGFNFAAKVATSATTTISVRPLAIDTITVIGSGLVTVFPGTTVIVQNTSYLFFGTATTPGALTFSKVNQSVNWGAGTNPVVSFNASGDMSVTTTASTTPGTYTIRVNLAGAGDVTGSFANNKTSPLTSLFSIVVVP